MDNPKIEFKWNFDTLGLISKKQSGKSTFIKKLIRNIPRDKIFILDSNLEYKDLGLNRVVPNSYDSVMLDKFILYCRKYTNILMIIEDADLYFSSAHPTEEFKKLLINGSHQNIGVIYTSKRPLGIPKLLLTETTLLFVGNFSIRNDIEYLRSIFDKADLIKELKRFQFLYKDSSGEEKIYSVTLD